MDLSKLPRLSESDRQPPTPATTEPPPEQATTPQPISYYPPPPAQGSGPEVWIGVAVGSIIQFMNGRFWSFVGHKLFGRPFIWTFSDSSGPITYTQSVFFLGDLAVVLFGLVLIFEGLILLLIRRRAMILFVLTFTLLTTALNLYYLISVMNKGYGFQIMSALAVAFGIYIAMHQKRLLQSTPA